MKDHLWIALITLNIHNIVSEPLKHLDYKLLFGSNLVVNLIVIGYNQGPEPCLKASGSQVSKWVQFTVKRTLAVGILVHCVGAFGYLLHCVHALPFL